jgi:heme A synthase
VRERVLVQRRFAAYAWCVVAYNVFVVLWGAFVRASGSGAGCGNHWPLCNGTIVPRAPALQTIIEFTHRATSGVALISVAGLLIWAWRAFPRRHPARTGALLAVVFMLTEALLGAALVLLEHVAQNKSAGRGISISLHLVNTLTLLGVLALTAWWGGGRAAPDPREWRGVSWFLGASLAGFMLLGISGAIAALGDTLFPASSVAAGIAQDASPGAHIFIRLRVLHPVIAVGVAFLLTYAIWRAVKLRPDPRRQWAALGLTMLLVIQIVLGAINIGLLAPIWLQIIHLLVADVLWISLILYSASAVATSASVGHPAFA